MIVCTYAATRPLPAAYPPQLENIFSYRSGTTTDCVRNSSAHAKGIASAGGRRVRERCRPGSIAQNRHYPRLRRFTMPYDTAASTSADIPISATFRGVHSPPVIGNDVMEISFSVDPTSLASWVASIGSAAFDRTMVNVRGVVSATYPLGAFCSTGVYVPHGRLVSLKLPASGSVSHAHVAEHSVCVVEPSVGAQSVMVTGSSQLFGELSGQNVTFQVDPPSALPAISVFFHVAEPVALVSPMVFMDVPDASVNIVVPPLASAISEATPSSEIVKVYHASAASGSSCNTGATVSTNV